MHMPQSLKTARCLALKKPFLSALLLISGMAAGTASAQVIVSDPVLEGTQATAQATQASQFAKQILQFNTQLSQWQQAIQQYEQLLETVVGLGTNISITSNQLQQITDPTSLIDQACPGTTGASIVGSMVTSLLSTVSFSQSITASQQQICANIVTVQVDEYNRTVIILNQMDQYGGTLQKLNNLANEVNTLGTTGGAITQATTISATMAHSIQEWQTSIKGDQALISALQEQQSILAKVAMNGSNTILGNIVQASTFAAAFH